ncbi:MAG: ABC transporter substrate-binding protein [Bacillota bacterium]|nr:ABC transporter substrate-binding protein [Bacillota bacterium]
MRRKNSLFILLLLLVFSLTVALFGCGKEQVSSKQKADLVKSEKKQQADTIRLGGGDWGYPTPFTHYPRGPGSRKMRLIFDTLVASDAEGKILPRLASVWQVSEDGLVYTFKLRPGVKWHDGQPLTAEDVVFSYEYQKQYPPVSAADLSAVRKVEAVDGQTVRIELGQPEPRFLTNLASFTIIPKHIWEKVTDPYNFVAPEAAVGSGPYRLADYSKEHGTYRFEVNQDFWGSKPRVKVIEFVPVSEEVLAFEKGEVDRITIPPDLLSRFENNPEYRVMRYETTWAYRLYFNMKRRPELADKAFRQALAYAINRQELVEKVERGAAVPGNPGVLHPSNKLYNSEVPQYPYYRQKAEDLLNGLGYKDTDGDGVREGSRGKKLSFQLLADEGSARLAELIKQQLALIGMEVNVKAVDMKTRDARFEEGDFELCINGSGDGENLEELTSKSKTKATSTTAKMLGYHNPEVDKLFSAQKKETDPGKRLALMAELQRIVAEELPKLTLYYKNSLTVHRPSVYDGWSQETYHSDSRENFVND